MVTERQLLAVLSNFARTMVTDPVQRILDRFVTDAVEILPVTSVGVTLLSTPTGPRSVAASDDAAFQLEELQADLGDGPGHDADRSSAPVSAVDLAHEHRWDRFVPRARRAGFAAVFSFPLRQADRRLGAVDLYRDRPGSLDVEARAAAEVLAEITAAYLVNAQSRADLEATSLRSWQSALHDPLTGLPNRTLLIERLDHALLRGRRTGRSVTILMADLDHFKAINDIHGPQVGDDMLVAAADRLSGLLRPGDTLARISGDEFVIVCEDLGGEGESDGIAARIAGALAAPFVLAGVEVEMSASVGIAFAGLGADIPEQLLHDADAAMRQAKRKGGSHHQVIDLREQQLAAQRATLEQDLRSAVRRGELRAAYQPIVDTTDGRIVGVEALLRWDHPTRGAIPPTTLIPLAERSGLIVDIGHWVLEQACSDRRQWACLGHDDLGMSVNVSARQLMAPRFAATVREVLLATGTRPDLLTLEVTESVFLQDAHRALVVLGELKGMGVRLALDDFGTGYSSLSYLKRFPVDVVKIDRAFTVDLPRAGASHAIVAAVIALAHRLGMEVVTEGVETADQHREAAALGSESCQGFYFARPMSAERFDVSTPRSSGILDLRLPRPWPADSPAHPSEHFLS